MNRPHPADSKTRVARHRAAMREKGYRLKQFWLPDVRTAAFKEQARRDSAAMSAQIERDDDMAFVEAAQYWPEQDD
ncbi:antitoxin MazE family protein [Sphingomonas sp. Root710]|uniref:antitoxin MazE family protein n=1 Tax=Sphingomonas sp. Root710 TaxID=1736594 RepID=UPI0009EC4FA9|nr:antitoxin MazE family protein [Sphingomonas sp. Root710]